MRSRTHTSVGCALPSVAGRPNRYAVWPSAATGVRRPLDRDLFNYCGYTAGAAFITGLISMLFLSAVPDTLGEREIAFTRGVAVVFLYPTNIAVCFFASRAATRDSKLNHPWPGLLVWFSAVVVQLFFFGIIPLLWVSLLAASYFGSRRGSEAKNA